MNHQAIEFAQYRAQCIKDLVPQLNKSNIQILDFGCGDGLLTNYLQTVFFESTVSGADQSVSELKYARSAYPEIPFTKIKNQQLPFPDNYFDCVVASLVLHHIPRVKHAHWVAEIMRVLKPNGIFIAQELNPYNLFAYWRFKRDPEEKGAQMVSPFYIRNLLKNYDVRKDHWFKRIPFDSLYTTIGGKKFNLDY